LRASGSSEACKPPQHPLPPLPRFWQPPPAPSRQKLRRIETCSIPRLQAPRILRAQAWKYASQPASKPRRSLGAASATAHHNVVGVVALPKEAAHVRDVLAAPP